MITHICSTDPTGASGDFEVTASSCCALVEWLCCFEHDASCAEYRARHSKPLAIKRLAILEVALQTNPESEELLLVMMCEVLPEVRCGQVVW